MQFVILVADLPWRDPFLQSLGLGRGAVFVSAADVQRVVTSEKQNDFYKWCFVRSRHFVSRTYQGIQILLMKMFG